jgi:hypothetical protein
VLTPPFLPPKFIAGKFGATNRATSTNACFINEGLLILEIDSNVTLISICTAKLMLLYKLNQHFTSNKKDNWLKRRPFMYNPG